jgi:hypothetical protein
MTDVDAAHQGVLTAFGWRQSRHNPAGIGNECTHWIYAALFEARALDFDRALHIAQTGEHYTWGRPIQPALALAGDIVQFRNYHNVFTYWIRGEDPAKSYDMKRGPLHTAMVGVTQSHTFDGQHLLLESHLHQPGVAVMTIRPNRVYDDNFAVALTAREFADLRRTSIWPDTVNSLDPENVARNVAWRSLRDRHPFPLHDAEVKLQQAWHGHTQNIDPGIHVLFRLRTTGEIRCFRPQQSPARLAMNAAQLQAEKQRLIAMMIRSGRRGALEGHGHHLDEYGSDNKRVRLHDHRFDWQFDAASVH